MTTTKNMASFNNAHPAHEGGFSVHPREGVARDHRLRDGAAEGHHREAAVLELRKAHPLLALLVRREESRQAVVAGGLERVPLEDLLAAAELNEADPEEDLHVHADRTVELVVGVEDVRDRLEGVALARDADEVRHDEAEPRQHRDAPVLQLGLTEVGHELRVLGGEAKRVVLVAAPRAISADETLRELAVVEELDARLLVGDGEVTASGLLLGTAAQPTGDRGHRDSGHR